MLNRPPPRKINYQRSRSGWCFRNGANAVPFSSLYSTQSCRILDETPPPSHPQPPRARAFTVHVWRVFYASRVATDSAATDFNDWIAPTSGVLGGEASGSQPSKHGGVEGCFDGPVASGPWAFFMAFFYQELCWFEEGSRKETNNFWRCLERVFGVAYLDWWNRPTPHRWMHLPRLLISRHLPSFVTCCRSNARVKGHRFACTMNLWICFDPQPSLCLSALIELFPDFCTPWNHHV